MLNLEIYRKTLRGIDTSIISSGKGKENETENDKNKKGIATVNEEEISSMTGTIINLMSTDSAKIADYSSWW